MTLELLLLIGSLLAMVGLLWLAFRPWRAERAERDRLSRLINREQGETTASLPPRPSPLRRMVLAAGLDVNPLLVMLVLLVIAVVFAVFIATVFGGSLVIALVAFAFAFWLCIVMMREAGRIRMWRFESRFVDAVELAAGALTAGEEPEDAFAHAADATEEPVRSELTQFVERLRSSMPIEAALRPMNERYDCEPVRLFSQLMIAKWETGGQLAPALKDISRTGRIALRLRRQLYASISGAQMAGLIVAIVPYLLLLFFMVKRPDAIGKIWTYSYGPQLFLSAVLLQIIGLVWLRRLLRTDL